LQAELELKADNVSTAVNLIDESIQAAQNVQYVLAEGISQRVKGNILSTIGQQDNALAAFLKSLEQIGEQDPFELARTKMDLASHYLKQPSQELATIKKLFDEALDTFERLDASREIRQVEELLSDELFNEILEGSN